MEGSSENGDVLDSLRKEAASVLELGRSLSLSYGTNESKMLQQVFSWEVEKAYGPSS